MIAHKKLETDAVPMEWSADVGRGGEKNLTDKVHVPAVLGATPALDHLLSMWFGPRWRLFACHGVVLASALCAGRSVWAQEGPRACRARTIEHDLDRADRLSSRNSALALLHLRALRDRCPSPRTEGALALVLVAARQWREAYERLTRVQTETSDAWVVAQRTVIENARSQCVEHLPRLSPQTNVPGATLRVNGSEVGTLPLAHPHVLAAGAATIELISEGYVPIRRTVSLAEGEVFREMLTLERIAVQPEFTPPAQVIPTDQAITPPGGRVVTANTPEPSSHWTRSPSQVDSRLLAPPRQGGVPRWVPWTLFGSGIAGVAAGAALWGVREQAVGTCMILGERIECPTPDAAQAARGANGFGTAALSVGALGLALSSTGGIWLLARALSGARPPPALTVAAHVNSLGFFVGLGGDL